MEERDFASDASKMGWVTEDEWKGKPDAWRPAKEFVERGENIVPILKDRLKKVEGKYEKDREKIKNLETDIKSIIKLNKSAEKKGFNAAKKEYDLKIKELDLEEFDAVQDGDVEKFKEVKEKKEALDEPEKPEETKEETNIHPDFEDWSKKNDWYQKDDELTEYAEFVGDRLRKGGETAEGLDFFKKVEDKVKNAFPTKFTNPNRDEPDKTESGNPAPVKKGKKTFSDLPDDAKEAYNRLKKRFEMNGHEYKKETYVESYFEED